MYMCKHRDSVSSRPACLVTLNYYNDNGTCSSQSVQDIFCLSVDIFEQTTNDCKSLT